jgi:hypothetical protein
MAHAAQPRIETVSRSSWAAPLLALALTGAAAVSVIYPLYVIRPFRPQGEREFAAALTVMRAAPFLTVAVLIVVSLLAIQLWAGRRLFKAICILSIVLTAFFTAAARINIFEKMFHPLGAPSFLPQQKAAVEAGDMVLAIREGKLARAYPIREMAYHHIVNDYLAGTPVVVTY